MTPGEKEAVKQKITKTLMIVGGIILAIAVLAIVAIKVISGLKSGNLSKSKKSKAGKKKSYDDYYDDDSEYDDDDEDDFDEFDEDEDDLPKRKQKSGFGKQKAASVISGLIPKKSEVSRGKARAKSEPEDLDDDEDYDDYYERSARYTPKAPVRYEPDEMEAVKPAAGRRKPAYPEEDDDYGYDEELPERKPQKSSRPSKNTGKYIPKH